MKLKPRPIIRTSLSLRDDRLFIVACDDTYAPKQYFDAFQITRVKVHVVPTEDGSSVAKHVLSRLEQFDCDEDDELWMLLDTDHCLTGSHLPGFLSALQEARHKGINVALSKPCFEVWLLLHHLQDLDQLQSLKNAAVVENLLKDVLGGYNKTNISSEKYTLELVAKACEIAEKVDALVEGGDNPKGVTSRVYLLWKAIASKALPSQLPVELRGLIK